MHPEGLIYLIAFVLYIKLRLIPRRIQNQAIRP